MKRVWLALMGMVAGLVTASPGWAAAPAGRYTVATDTVRDNKTGLTWQRGVPTSYYSWANAQSYCQALNLGGFSSGWRLPTKKELETLVDRRDNNPSIDSTAFPNTPSEWFWTSTPYASAGSAWYVYFDFGFSDYGDTTYICKVRCVR
ncbi:MAG: DUF1566 domain-containing protein [Deltaproteobacteria bacterium]|nr:DUF1566 domain-containing protein [Deltaproteobacteria bacterium]